MAPSAPFGEFVVEAELKLKQLKFNFILNFLSYKRGSTD